MGKKRPANWATPVGPKSLVIQFKGFGDDNEKCTLCSQKIEKTLSFLPGGVQEQVWNNLFIRVERPMAVLATYVPKGATFIQLREELFDKTFPEVAFTIAHEVAHFIKGHRADVRDEDIEQLIEQGNDEANEQAIKWLKDEFPEETLREFLKIPRNNKQ